jgi:hypothetical protein
MAQAKRYFWNISKANKEWEALSLEETSSDIKNGERGFLTAQAAYNAGLKKLRNEYEKDVYMLEIHYEDDAVYPPEIGYETSYVALSVDGKIQKSC